MTRWCTARARCSPRWRATTGRNSRRCAPTTPSCGAIRARSCCSWAGVRAVARMVGGAELDWLLLDSARMGRAGAGARPQPRLPRALPALHARDCEPGGLRMARSPTTARTRSSPGCAFAGEGGRRSPSCNFTPVPREDYRAAACPRRALARILNTDAAGLWRKRHGQHGRGQAAEAEPSPRKARLGEVTCRRWQSVFHDATG
jgi:hypothetical protein